MNAQRILIIDEDSNWSGNLVAAAMGTGRESVVSSDWKDAIFKMGAEKFFLVVADLNMSKGIDDAALDEMLKQCVRNKTYIFISSQKISGEVDKKLFGRPGLQMVPKPFEVKTFINHLNELTGEWKLLSSAEPKKTLDVRIVNPIIVSATEAVSSAFSLPLKVGKPYVRKDKEISGDISAVIGLTSQNFKGNISISFCELSYLKVVSKLTGVEFKEINEDARDAIAEIINSIVESAQTKFKQDSMLVIATKPSIISDPHHSLSHQTQRPPIVISFQNESNEGFRIEISLAV